MTSQACWGLRAGGGIAALARICRDICTRVMLPASRPVRLVTAVAVTDINRNGPDVVFLYVRDHHVEPTHCIGFLAPAVSTRASTGHVVNEPFRRGTTCPVRRVVISRG